jgi:hypothetical protein
MTDAAATDHHPGHHRTVMPDLSLLRRPIELPAVAINALWDNRQADIGALREAGTITIESIKEAANHQLDIFTSTLNEMGRAVGVLPQGTRRISLLARPGELVRAAVEGTLASLNDVAGNIQNSQAQIALVAIDITQSNLAEIRKVVTDFVPAQAQRRHTARVARAQAAAATEPDTVIVTPAPRPEDLLTTPSVAPSAGAP